MCRGPPRHWKITFAARPSMWAIGWPPMARACRPPNSLRTANPAASRPPRGTDSARSLLQNLAGIHDAPRVQRALQCAHDVEFRCSSKSQQLLELVLTDAVFGAEAAAVAVCNVVYAVLNCRRAPQEIGRIERHGLADVEMQIAVADVSEWHDARRWNLRLNPLGR